MVDDMHSREITFGLFSHRAMHCGERMLHFGQDVVVNWRVDWKKGCYRVIYGDKDPWPLLKIQHRSGDKAQVEYPMRKRTCKTSHNWSDMLATLVHPPLPDTKCHTFFGDGEGPWIYQQVGKKGVPLQSLVDNVKQQWEAAMSTQKTATTQAKQANEKKAAAALQVLHDTQAEANKGAARAKTKAVLEKNTQRKLFSYVSDPGAPTAKASSSQSASASQSASKASQGAPSKKA